MNYTELLKNSASKNSSIVCMGLDPLLDEIPISLSTKRDTIVSFYEGIFNKIVQRGVLPSAVKPNFAYYAQYGVEGIEALVSLIHTFRGNDIPVILDVKRGDIGTTAAAYSRESFDFYKADAVTLSPFLGIDAIAPFMDLYPDKGYYILNKTSNRSSFEIQDLIVDSDPLFAHVSKKIVEWYRPGMGAVVGATYPEQLSLISEIFMESGREIPLLIPGVGTQGGSIDEVCAVLSRYPDPRIHRINSSSAINYAYKKRTGMRFDEAAAEALALLTDEINRSLGL